MSIIYYFRTKSAALLYYCILTFGLYNHFRIEFITKADGYHLPVSLTKFQGQQRLAAAAALRQQWRPAQSVSMEQAGSLESFIRFSPEDTFFLRMKM